MFWVNFTVGILILLCLLTFKNSVGRGTFPNIDALARKLVRDIVSRKGANHYFWPKSAEKWRHSDVIHGWSITTLDTIFGQYVQHYFLDWCSKFRVAICFTFGDILDSRRGRVPRSRAQRGRPPKLWFIIIFLADSRVVDFYIFQHIQNLVSKSHGDVNRAKQFLRLRPLSFSTGMRSRDIFGRVWPRLRLRGSIPAPAPAPAPSKTVGRLRLRLRLRAKCTGSGGSGSGSGSDDQFLIWALTSNTISKMTNVKIWLLTDLAMSLNATLNECLWNFVIRCHPRPLADIGEATDSFGLRCLR